MPSSYHMYAYSQALHEFNSKIGFSNFNCCEMHILKDIELNITEFDTYLEDHQNEDNEKSLADSSLHLDMYGSQDFEMDRHDHQVNRCNVYVGNMDIHVLYCSTLLLSEFTRHM